MKKDDSKKTCSQNKERELSQKELTQVTGGGQFRPLYPRPLKH